MQCLGEAEGTFFCKQIVYSSTCFIVVVVAIELAFCGGLLADGCGGSLKFSYGRYDRMNNVWGWIQECSGSRSIFRNTASKTPILYRDL